MQAEKRAQQRSRAELSGKVDLKDGTAPLQCTVSDISSMGARLAVNQDERTLPDKVTLWLTPDGKVQRNCTVAWRRPGELGVTFD